MKKNMQTEKKVYGIVEDFSAPVEDLWHMAIVFILAISQRKNKSLQLTIALYYLP